jgi:hypothetical protein
METTIEIVKEPWYKTLVFYPFRVITSLLSALSMDESGFSLKKILATAGTTTGIWITKEHSCKENAIAYLIIWLVWVGILVGIYSLKDISNAFTSYKTGKI